MKKPLAGQTQSGMSYLPKAQLQSVWNLDSRQELYIYCKNTFQWIIHSRNVVVHSITIYTDKRIFMFSFKTFVVSVHSFTPVRNIYQKVSCSCVCQHRNAHHFAKTVAEIFATSTKQQCCDAFWAGKLVQLPGVALDVPATVSALTVLGWRDTFACSNHSKEILSNHSCVSISLTCM